MPTITNGVARFNFDDPKDMASLIATGLIWRGGPEAFDAATAYLRDHPEAVNAKVPASVLATLQSAQPTEGQPEAETPVETAAEPTEEPVDVAAPSA